MNSLPTPHGDKLRALIVNEKLPVEDQPRVRQAIEGYERWLQKLHDVQGDYSEIIQQMISLLNVYKRQIEVDLIFDSSRDFLYRQKGQLKLDNTIILVVVYNSEKRPMTLRLARSYSFKPHISLIFRKMSQRKHTSPM